jgi:FkbM family methyltransferase
MPLSFAQNSEDVLLWRCFRDKKKGFYVDVGASSPITDSVTHLFYEQGWSGLNLEPLPERVAELSRLRPRDRSLCLAVGAAPGSAKLARTRGMGGLSTLYDATAPGVVTQMADAWEIETRLAPLSLILEEEKIGEIDFLKIDVEGAEAAVLDTLDLSRWRPAVILVEATLPMTTTPSHACWEAQLLACGYSFCWFDGLNRFYLAQERSDLARHFDTPPNVHDAMPRFAGFGSALCNPEHPDHGFALHLASLLLRAPGIETDAYLEQVMRKDRPPALFDKPVDRAAVTELYLLVLERHPEPATVDMLVAEELLNGTMLLRRLLHSHEFRIRRSRIAG